MSRQGPNVGFIRKEVETQLPKWGIVEDSVAGEVAIKSRGDQYLPKPETNTDEIKNQTAYEKYKLRAVFFPVTGRTVEGLVGQVFSKKITTDFPSSLDILNENTDGAGTTLEQQAKSALEEVLKKGRGGLLSDFPQVPEGVAVTQADVEAGRFRPRILFYKPEQIINWRETTIGGETQLSLLVLKEEKIVKDDGFEFETSPRWRVYKLNDADGVLSVSIEVWKLENDKNSSNEFVIDEETIFPVDSSQSPLRQIPFSFIGSVNNDSSVDPPPLFQLACLNIAHYRNSADYEQSAFLVGQATPVFSGLTDQWMKDHIKGQVTLGSSNAVGLPQGATAELLQASPNSMPMEAMKHKEDQMKAVGAKLIEPGAVQRTATEVEIEEVSEASVLSSIAKNLSSAYRSAFYYCSLFIDEVPIADITIELNSEFQISGLAAPERQEVVAAWQAGILAWEEVREIYRRKGIATLDDDEALVKIDGEDILLGSGAE
tara:strand:- start:3874 stop:5334 length:1461 start_codon:yes stop_codon:yes gene_type:complete